MPKLFLGSTFNIYLCGPPAIGWRLLQRYSRGKGRVLLGPNCRACDSGVLTIQPNHCGQNSITNSKSINCSQVFPGAGTGARPMSFLTLFRPGSAIYVSDKGGGLWGPPPLSIPKTNHRGDIIMVSTERYWHFLQDRKRIF